MAGHLTPVAQKVAQAIEAGSTLDQLARELLDEAGEIQRAVAIDVGSRKWLVVLPGYGPLADPREFVMLADQVA